MDSVPRSPVRRAGGDSGRRLRVIGKEPLAAVLDLAVSRALRREMPRYDAERVAAVQDIVRREFRNLLRDNTRAIRGIPRSEFLRELDRSRDEVLAARDRARRELAELTERTALLKGVVGPPPEAGTATDTFREERLTEALAPRVTGLLAREGVPRRELRRELLEAAAEEARREWERALGERRRAAELEIDRYEQRIAKLTGSLERTEKALRELSRLKEGDGGVASIYRTVQGLSAEEEDFEAKQEMLARLFEANLELRRALDEEVPA